MASWLSHLVTRLSIFCPCNQCPHGDTEKKISSLRKHRANMVIKDHDKTHWEHSRISLESTSISVQCFHLVSVIHSPALLKLAGINILFANIHTHTHICTHTTHTQLPHPCDLFFRNRSHFPSENKAQKYASHISPSIKAWLAGGNWGGLQPCISKCTGLNNVALQFFPNRRKHTWAPKSTRNAPCFRIYLFLNWLINSHSSQAHLSQLDQLRGAWVGVLIILRC